MLDKQKGLLFNLSEQVSTLQTLLDCNGEPYFKYLDKALDCSPTLNDWLREWFEDGNTAKSLSDFDEIDRDVVNQIELSAEFEGLKELGKANKYHDPDHWYNVAELGTALGEEQGFSATEKHLLRLFGLLHDTGHTGTIRGADYEDNIPQAVENAVSLCRQYGVSLPNALRLVNMIVASTSFNDSIEPSNQLERTAVMADIGTFLQGFEKSAEAGLNVAQEMGGNKPSNFGAWIQGQVDFLHKNVREDFEKWSQLGWTPKGWEGQLETVIHQFKKFGEDPEKSDRIYRSFLRSKISPQELLSVVASKVNMVLGEGA